MRQLSIGLWTAIAMGASAGEVQAQEAGRAKLHALVVPLADHYAAVVAQEKYASEMKKADFSVEVMKSWPDLRGKFLSGQADVAFIISTLAMDMYTESPKFRMISLAHRDGNALAINDLLEKRLKLPAARSARKPDAALAEAIAAYRKEKGEPVTCAVPTTMATHVIVLYKYLKQYGMTLAISQGDADVVAKAVPPPSSPDFLKRQSAEGKAACFEQSLPWADVVETQGFGKVAWYSKDVIKWPKGHVECIVIASDDAIKNKREALMELIKYVQQAGRDLEDARAKGGKDLDAIAALIHKRIPGHDQAAIVNSLSPELNVINYANLSPDKPGLKLIMDLGLESKVLKKGIDLGSFVDESISAPR